MHLTWRVGHEGQQAAGLPVQDPVEAVRLAADVGVPVILSATEVLPTGDRLELTGNGRGVNE